MPILELQPDETTGQDSYSDSANPTINYGAATYMWIGQYIGGGGSLHRGFIKFDLSALPDNAIIDSATLQLRAGINFGANVRVLRVYRLKRAWVEAQVSHNIWATGKNWLSPGAFHPNDCEQSDIGNVSVPTTSDVYVTLTLTPTTKAGLDLGNGLLLKMDTESNDMHFFHSSTSPTPAYWPKLTINYHMPRILNELIVLS